ncbi:uncharacterized protein B0I36DRAFT_358610 [Microdochium trichocladiopsis]|uniref:Glucose-methanol-choline oxidoreductase C-terminal domain-containing protein n=1 Tax=Microdochium trichocladiopsis TaxID=1682393 RepID=A0A9P9BUX6_9PEZI|nr:uncharacterized protein B0I36DRAFT_358610 [Microdochium trichocladiopsis]KAH7041441.1 hypothetical protein B0I36DRAFT_358610 [Microdochium trichocladiopsis]
MRDLARTIIAKSKFQIDPHTHLVVGWTITQEETLWYININTSNPNGPSVVDWRTYSNPVDYDILIAIARFYRKLNLEFPVYAPFQPDETGPGLGVQTKDEGVAWIRDQSQPTTMHPTRSCRIVPRALGGVVNAELKVDGLQGLRWWTRV